MLKELKAESVYIVCGYTDMRRSIDGLAAIVQQNFGLELCSGNLFLFCGRRHDRLKTLLWEGDGFLLLYKRLENGAFQWPRNGSEAKQLTPKQYTWLMQASMYLKIYDREIFPFSFDDTKKSIQDYFSTARDETFVISEYLDVDNNKRRSEIISLILALEKHSQPHSTAIISTYAQFLISAEKKICLSLSKDFYSNILPTEEHKMCTELVGINYNEKTKEHTCMIEKFENK